MTLYLKYRPQTLEEIDLKDVRESLKKIVSSGKIPHAFLFSGPKGAGKTSAARIIAKILNCEARTKNSIDPCNKCSQCTSITKGGNLDVIELDAASHRGIDDVRALRDAVKLAPAKADRKVYIIDESHMLTPEASNALLKTLEEPPEHVMFILATTNPEKLTDTIRSRATNIAFKKANREELVRSLKRAAKGEKMKIKDDALNLIAKASDGSFRDAVKILEQLTFETKDFGKEKVDELLFFKKVTKVDTLFDLLREKNTKGALEEVERVIEKGVSISNYLDEILTRLREGLLAKVGVEGEELTGFTKEELVYLIRLISKAAEETRLSLIEQLPLEIAIVTWCEPKGGKSEKKANKEEKDRKVKKKESKKRKNPGPSKSANSLKNPISEEMWKEILAKVRPINTSIEALLRAAKPIEYDGSTLTLAVYYRFHKERLEDGQHRRVLEDIAKIVLGNSVKVVCELAQPPKKIKEKEKEEEAVLTESEDEDIIKVAEEIFGN